MKNYEGKTAISLIQRALFLISFLFLMFNGGVALGWDYTNVDLNFNIKKVEPVKGIFDSPEGLSKIIPTNIPRGASENNISKRIIDRSFNSFMQSEQFKKSSVGRSVSTISKAVRPDVRIIKPTKENPTSLQVNFFLPENLLKVDLESNLVNSKVRYTLDTRILDIELFKQLSGSTSLTITHREVFAELTNQTTVNLRYVF